MDDPLSPDELDLIAGVWEAQAPPDDFARSVVRARSAEQLPSPDIRPLRAERAPTPSRDAPKTPWRTMQRGIVGPNPTWLAAAALLIAVVALAYVVHAIFDAPPERHALTERVVPLAGVGFALSDHPLEVALDTDGSLRVHQRRGEAVYKLNAPGRVVVVTPEREVGVVGVSFAVRVEHRGGVATTDVTLINAIPAPGFQWPDAPPPERLHRSLE